MVIIINTVSNKSIYSLVLFTTVIDRFFSRGFCIEGSEGSLKPFFFSFFDTLVFFVSEPGLSSLTLQPIRTVIDDKLSNSIIS